MLNFISKQASIFLKDLTNFQIFFMFIIFLFKIKTPDSTGLHTSSSIRCESRKCINFTFYDQLASRVLRLILADLINVHKTWTYNRKTNWLHFNKHCKFWIAALFFASAIFIHFYNLKRALLWSLEKRWPFHTLHAGLLNVAVWRLVYYIQEHTLVAKISKTTCYLQRRF